MFEDAVCNAYCTDAFARKFELCVQPHKVLNSLRYPTVTNPRKVGEQTSSACCFRRGAFYEGRCIAHIYIREQ